MVIRPLRTSEVGALSEFMKQHFLRDLEVVARSHEPEYYAWKYFQNPAGRAAVRVAEEAGRIVGFFGVWPKWMWIQGKRVLSGERGDSFVAPEHHGKGVYSRLVASVFEECRDRGLTFTIASPNERNRPICVDHYGGHLVFEYKSLVLPLDFSSILSKRCGRFAAASLVGRPLTALHSGLFQRATTFRLLPLDSSYEEIDAIWARNRDAYVFSVVKDRAYVEWRYVTNPEAYEIHLVMDGDESIGFVVFKIQDILGFRFAHLVDMLLPSKDEGLLKGCIGAVQAHARSRDIDWLSTWAPKGSPFLRCLKRSGFIGRRKRFNYVVHFLEENIPLPLGRERVKEWNFMQGDTDNI